MPNKRRHTATLHAGQVITQAVLLSLLGGTCTSTTPRPPRQPGVLLTELTLPPPPPTPEVDPTRLALYGQWLPHAARFTPRAIPASMLLAADRGNETYVLAEDAAGRRIGILRDVIAPVIPGRTTDVDLLDLTLLFDADLKLTHIIAHRPLLQRNGHPLDNEARRALLALANAPPAELLAVPRPDDMVDAVTGATHDALGGIVVPGAAYTSRRLAGLVRDTRALIEQAPLVWDRQRLQAVLEPPATDAALALALERLLATLTTLEARGQAYQMMAHAYALALAAGEPPQVAIDAQLLAGLPDDPNRITQLAQACYQLARRDLHRKVINECAAQVQHARTVDPVWRARLLGTAFALRGEPAAALPELRKAAAAVELERDPELHLRLSLATHASGHAREACDLAQQLFRDHPLLPGVNAALGACPGDTAAIVERLHAEMRADLLARRQTVERVVPSLSLEDDHLRPVEWTPTAGQVNVLVAFSTWCPHCLAEIPRVDTFYATVQQRDEWRAAVQVIGLRTAVERERMPYEVFLSLTHPSFPILTDSAWSLAFTQLVRNLGLRAELPTLLVIDRRGVVRFVLAAGDYRDTARELSWAVGALLEEQPFTPGATP